MRDVGNSSSDDRYAALIPLDEGIAGKIDMQFFTLEMIIRTISDMIFRLGNGIVGLWAKEEFNGLGSLWDVHL